VRGGLTEPAGEHSPKLDRLDSNTGITALKAVLQRDGCSKAAEVGIGEFCTNASSQVFRLSRSRNRGLIVSGSPGLAISRSRNRTSDRLNQAFALQRERESPKPFSKKLLVPGHPPEPAGEHNLAVDMTVLGRVIKSHDKGANIQLLDDPRIIG